MVKLLQVVLIGNALLDFGLFAVISFKPALLKGTPLDLVPGPHFAPLFKGAPAGALELYARALSLSILLLGIMRLHGGINWGEKGAYRVALWSYVGEIMLFAREIQAGTLPLMPFAAICGGLVVAILLMSAQYKAVLYPAKTKKQ
jgi:hypothetical protein